MSDSKNPVGRRGFLKRAAAGGAGLAATAPIALAQQAALKPATGSAAEVTSSVRPGSDCQSRLQFPRPAGILHQLRQEHQPRVAHLLP
jgi:hypothetical protein